MPGVDGVSVVAVDKVGMGDAFNSELLDIDFLPRDDLVEDGVDEAEFIRTNGRRFGPGVAVAPSCLMVGFSSTLSFIISSRNVVGFLHTSQNVTWSSSSSSRHIM